jgi:hypothetical protein
MKKILFFIIAALGSIQLNAQALLLPEDGKITLKEVDKDTVYSIPIKVDTDKMLANAPLKVSFFDAARVALDKFVK